MMNHCEDLGYLICRKHNVAGSARQCFGIILGRSRNHSTGNRNSPLYLIIHSVASKMVESLGPKFPKQKQQLLVPTKSLFVAGGCRRNKDDSKMQPSAGSNAPDLSATGVDSIQPPLARRSICESYAGSASEIGEL